MYTRQIRCETLSHCFDAPRHCSAQCDDEWRQQGAAHTADSQEGGGILQKNPLRLTSFLLFEVTGTYILYSSSIRVKLT